MEDNIEDDVAVNDEQKFSALFEVIGIELPENNRIQRLGKQNTKYKRIIEMDVTNKSIRDEILKHAKLLNAKGSPWDVIYIKNDLHPVIVQENNRLRHKKNNLQKLDENKNHVIKIENGKLTNDGLVIDQNMFFV